MLCKQQGIILVTVLLFLFVFSLLALTSLSSSQQQLRMSNNLASRNQMLFSAEAGLLAGEKVVLTSSNSPCIKDAVAESNQLEPWLVGNSCILGYNSQPVHYTIERRYADACLVTGTGANKQALLHKGDIYLITAWVEQFNKPVLVLQSTYAKAQTETCIKPIAEIKPGRLSWREVYALS